MTVVTNMNAISGVFPDADRQTLDHSNLHGEAVYGCLGYRYRSARERHRLAHGGRGAGSIRLRDGRAFAHAHGMRCVESALFSRRAVPKPRGHGATWLRAR